MKDRELKEAIASIADFTDAEMHAIASKGTIVTVPAQWAPMAKGTPADKAYLIVDGEMSIRHGSAEIARLGQGELVGELAFARKSLRTATVVTETPATVLHFTKQAWQELLRTMPKLSASVASVAAARS